MGQTAIRFTVGLRLNRVVSTQRRDRMELQQVRKNISVLVGEEPEQGQTYELQSQQHRYIDVVFAPQDCLDIAKPFGLQLDLHVGGIGHQLVGLLARSVRPGLQASAQSLQFPTVLANLAPERCEVRTLSLTNLDRQPLTVEFNSESDEFCVMTAPLTEPLAPGRKLEVEVRFQPLHAQRYSSAINVVVNGLYKLRYGVHGTAVDCAVVPDRQHIALGSVLIGARHAFRQTVIRNRSSADVVAELSVSEEHRHIDGLFFTVCPLESQQELTAKVLDMLPNWADKNLKRKYLQGLPRRATIEANSQAAFIVFYAPNVRMIDFDVPVDLTINGCLEFQDFIHLTGSGIGASLKLCQKTLELPICMENSYVISQFQVENSGDMPVSYSIDLPPKNIVKKSLLSLFESNVIQIYPQQATVHPGKLFNVFVKFSPPKGFHAQKIIIPNMNIDFIDDRDKKVSIG